MFSFARVVGSFLAMMAIGYLAVILLFPAPTSTFARQDDVVTGRSVATQLSDQARSLAAHKPMSMTQ